MKKFSVPVLLSFALVYLFSSAVFAQSTTTPTTPPASLSPSSTSDILAEIQKLLTLITSLQTQLNELKAEQTKVTQELGTSSTTTVIPSVASQETESIAPFSPTPLPTVTLTRTLGRGTIGNDVRELQLFLKSLPGIYPEGLLTNFYGPLTEKAVQRFQAEYGIIDSGTAATTGFGTVGSKTQAKIRELMTQGAGRSGNIPPGLLTAPGIQKKLELETPTASAITPSGTIPAQPTGQTGTTTIPAIPAQQNTTTPTGITVLSPNGGEQWIKGNTYSITWYNPLLTGFPGDKNFTWKVIVENSEGKFWHVGIFPLATPGTNWTVPLSLPDSGTAYKARVVLERACTSTPCPSHADVLRNTAFEDVSDNTFSIYALAMVPVPPPPAPPIQTPTPSTIPSTGTVASTTTTATTTTATPPPPAPTPVPSPTPSPSGTTSTTTTTATDTIAPSVPMNLSASASTTSSQVVLTWTFSTDNVAVAGYKIYRDGAFVTNATPIGNGTLSSTDTGLSAGTSYSYTIAAYDAAGNVSAQSSSVSVTTQSVSPLPPPPPSSTNTCGSYSVSQEQCNLYFLKNDIKTLITSDSYGYQCSFSWSPQITCSDDSYGVTWRDPRTDTTPAYAYGGLRFDNQLYFKKIDLQGKSLTSEIQLTKVAGSVWYTAITWSGTEYGIAWADDRQFHFENQNIGSGGDLEVYFAKLAKNGTELTGEKRITYCTGSCYVQSLSWNTAGYYDLSYNEWVSGSGTSSYSLKLDASGNTLSTATPTTVYLASILEALRDLLQNFQKIFR